MDFEAETKKLVDSWYGHPLSNHLGNNVGRRVFMRDIPLLLAQAYEAGRQAKADEPMPCTFGDGTHDWRRCPCISCVLYRDSQSD